jgi:NodT family efflux transporter outer membrane factor (OMF) lipoprotein
MAILLGGCGLTQTTYQKPDVQVPEKWANEGGPWKGRGPAWWRSFDHDPALNILVDEVLEKNNDLAAAALRVKEARLRANLALNQFLPDLSATATGTRNWGLRRDGAATRTYTARVNASYEVDLWGKLASQSDAAAWEAAATEEDKAAAEIALIGTTINLYWKIGYLNERIALSSASMASAEKVLALAKAQYDAGAISGIDKAVAERNLASLQAAHTQYLQEKMEASNAFDILFDSPPGIGKANPPFLPHEGELVSLAPEVPATILNRRPDIRAAEYRLREALDDVDAVRASYLPTFSLTGSLGSSSVALSKVLTDPVGALGAGITLPFLNWFDMRNDVDISEAQYEEAVTNFRQTLYSALADVENALSARAKDAQRGKHLAQAAASARKAEQMVAVQYKEGYVSLETWLEAQETARSAEASVLENRYQQLTDVVTLYKALGGNVPR